MHLFFRLSVLEHNRTSSKQIPTGWSGLPTLAPKPLAPSLWASVSTLSPPHTHPPHIKQGLVLMNGASKLSLCSLRPSNPGLGEPIRWSPTFPFTHLRCGPRPPFWAAVTVCVNTEIRAITSAPLLLGRSVGAVPWVSGYQGGVVCKHRPSPRQVQLD